MHLVVTQVRREELGAGSIGAEFNHLTRVTIAGPADRGVLHERGRERLDRSDLGPVVGLKLQTSRRLGGGQEIPCRRALGAKTQEFEG